MSKHIHVIPVDPSLTAQEAWREQCIFGKRITWTGPEQWAVVECDGQECAGIEEPSPSGPEETQ